jgi:hypothetical protein
MALVSVKVRDSFRDTVTFRFSVSVVEMARVSAKFSTSFRARARP